MFPKLPGSTKEEAPQTATQDVEFSLLDQNGTPISFEEAGISLEDLQNNSDAGISFRSGNISANGHYSWFTTDVTFSAMENNGGTHGQASFTGPFWDFQWRPYASWWPTIEPLWADRSPR